MKQTAIAAFAATLIAAAAGAALADPAATPVAEGAGAQTQAAAPVKKAKVQTPTDIICRTETTTGSRLDSHRVCMTRAEWDQENQSARNAMDNSRIGATPSK